MSTKVSVVKIGGNVIDDAKQLNAFLHGFSKLEGLKILVHGGGKMSTKISKEMGLTPQMHQGRRITDQNTLEVVTMVYAGLINKNIVAQLQAFECNALGLSGADGNSIHAHKRDLTSIDYGFVGDIDNINSNFITSLLNQHITPVFCAITHNTKGQLLNTNADTIAAEIASSLSNQFDVSLNYCFEKKGVLRSINDEDSVIPHIDLNLYKSLLEEGIIADGMLPKLTNCFNALHKGVQRVSVGLPNMIVSPKYPRTQITL